ncbi:hypothetical protein HNE05_03810 [Aquipseudomonas campi]|uniref:Uncharacterized protein n=1 Tax=Aquipseudomonas campi TaxID=2731681 RepID=A0A6M8FED7_9GAMM|nr:hypothetical protein [Pseudomonas campi]QKE62520.1 hypothetical protein HNE05_03810 [Pseudomonas campi]
MSGPDKPGHPHRVGRSLRSLCTLPAAPLLILLVSEAHAFQPCPGASQPCASPIQVLLLVVLPCLVLSGLALLARKKLQRRWLRVSCWLLLASVGLLWLLAIYAAFNAFLAPCTTGCWYGIGS